MGCWLSRMTVLKNETDEDLEVRECPENGRCSMVVKLRRGEQEMIRANMFHQHSLDSLRPRLINVFILPRGGNERLGRSLQPEDFRRHAGLTFRLNEDQELVFDSFIESNFWRIKLVRALMGK